MNSLLLRHLFVFFVAISLFLGAGCGQRKEPGAGPDLKWEEAHFKAQEVIELLNVRRRATDRSYYYPREVADLDSDGVYEVIVGWHPQGGPNGVDLLWRVIGDTMVMSPDSALLWHDAVQMHFDSQKLMVEYPLWSLADSVCCPSIDVREVHRVSGDHTTIIATDTILRNANP